MASEADEHILIQKAVAGDAGPLSELLLRYYARLEARVKRKLPDDLRGLISAEDVVQVVHVEAFKTIARFKPVGEGSFYRWMATIADQRMLDKIKAQRRLKRGGGRKRIHKAAGAADSSIASLINVVAQHDATPSRSYARHERERVVHVELAHLKGDYREALQLRYIEELPVAEIAIQMKRTERAVHMLCNRGLKKLRAALGSQSRFYSISG